MYVNNFQFHISTLQNIVISSVWKHIAKKNIFYRNEVDNNSGTQMNEFSWVLVTPLLCTVENIRTEKNAYTSVHNHLYLCIVQIQWYSCACLSCTSSLTKATKLLPISSSVKFVCLYSHIFNAFSSIFIILYVWYESPVSLMSIWTQVFMFM